MACKVLQTKLWSTQIVIRVGEEPVCVSRGPGHSVLVATRSGAVELHGVSSQGRSHLICRFRTVLARVACLGLLPLHEQVQEAVVTVEAQDEQDSQTLCVYTAWRSNTASSSSSSSLVPHRSPLPLSSSVSSLAVCGAGASRFAVATTNAITLYQCLDGVTIVPLFEVAVASAAKLALYGDFLGWGVGPLVHVIKVVVAESSAQQQHQQQQMGVDFVVSGGAGHATRLNLPSLCKDQKPFIALGPFRNLSVCVRADDGWSIVDCDTVLVQRADANVHSLKLSSEPNIASVSGTVVDNSASLVRCLVSTSEVATLFSLSRPSLLARYTYASPTFMAVLDNAFLYALQVAQDRQGTSLVEVFSLRPSGLALPIRQLGDFSDWTLVSSHGGEGESSVELPPPCMMASLPFVGLQAVTPIKSGSVALMSKIVSNQDAFWSVSVLFPEKAVNIWRELAAKAAMVKENDPDTFLLFHLEGLLVLGSRLCQLTADRLPIDISVMYEHSAGLSTTDDLEETLPAELAISSDLIGSIAAADDYETTYSLFLESCRILGDFCESKKMFEAAGIFWGFCLLPIDEVTRRLLPERNAALTLVEFLNRALKDGDGRVRRVGVGVGNSLIEHLAKNRPAELPAAILACALSYDPSLAVGLLNRVGSSEETFARAFALCRTGESRQCAATLRSLDSTVLQQLLQSYRTSWLTEQGLSPFGQVLLDVCGFSVLEAVWQRRDRISALRARELLGGSNAPLYLVFLEQLLDVEPSAEVFELLAQGYLSRCSSETTECVPVELVPVIDQFSGMRLFDLSDAPLEIRWTLRHWRGRVKSSRCIWLDTIPPLSQGGTSANRTHFYTAKLQSLLIDARRLGHEACSRVGLLLEAGVVGLNRSAWLESCRFLWIPFVGKLEEALAFVCSRLSQDGAIGFCSEYCLATRDWKVALESSAGRPSLRSGLLAVCADRFDVSQLISEVLPEKDGVNQYLPFIWKAQKLSLLPTILAFTKNQQ